MTGGRPRKLNVKFTPSGATLERYLASRARRRFIFGPLGSGKTFTCAFDALRCARDQAPDAQGLRRTEGLVTRTTMPELKTTALKDWLELLDGKFRGELGEMTWGPPPIYRLRFALPDKTRVESNVTFLGLDDPDGIDRIRGMPLTWAWINEAREMPYGVVSMIFGRCGRFPRIADGGPTWSGTFGDTNMPDQEHWLYRFAEEEHPQGWEFFRQPGGVVKRDGHWVPNPSAENLENLPANYYTDQLAGASEDWIRVYLAAEYGYVHDGKPIYPEYVDAQHCREFEIVRTLGLYIGFDFGLTPAALFGQCLPNGAWRWHSEIVTEDTGYVAFARLVKRALTERYPGMTISAITGDPSGDARQPGDEDARTVFQILAANGVNAEPASTNDPVKRREAVAGALGRFIDGSPGLLIHPQCKITRKAMAGAYCYRRLRVGGSERYRDVPDKNMYSHVAEAGQYLMLGGGEGKRIVARERSAPRAQAARTEYDIFA